MRKAIQIDIDDDGYLNALCNDGTMWYLNLEMQNSDTPVWARYPDIPQDATFYQPPRREK